MTDIDDKISKQLMNNDELDNKLRNSFDKIIEDLKDIDKQKLLKENPDLTEEELEEKIDELEKRLKEEKDNFMEKLSNTLNFKELFTE